MIIVSQDTKIPRMSTEVEMLNLLYHMCSFLFNSFQLDNASFAYLNITFQKTCNTKCNILTY